MQTEFQTRGYLYIEQLLNPEVLYEYIKKLHQNGFGYADIQVPGAKVFYKEGMFEKLLDGIRPMIEEYSGYKLFNTYSFVRMYEMGDVLRPHKDRESCEVTVTIALGHDGKPWPVCLLDKDGTTQSITLNPGDALMFKGIEMLHWRDENVYGPCIQAFLHYVDQSGPYTEFKDDAPHNEPANMEMNKKGI